MTTILDFTEIIEKRGVDPKTARLVRHSPAIAAEYRVGWPLFLHAITYQAAKLDPFSGAKTAFQFIPGPGLPGGDQSALFVGAFAVGDSWRFGDGSRPAPLHCDRDRCFLPTPETIVYDITPLSQFEDLRDRVLIRWGASARSWSQWAATRRKEVVELRRDAMEPAFPGFAAFATTLDEIAALPVSWQGALRSVQGVYLLVCPVNGEQYVGSAYGEDGFWGRWLAYSANGHGGNRLLMARERTNFSISILEVASPDMSAEDIIAREGAWKVKLGSRAHGLNAN
ncbi:GIY-YIG nuclease family protein [Limibaculum sp. FT325]|uniref:GIY-YIG nuclease family protein n=1 Tax=Thermohalobaculum sediminis TaxID=2939436 RepID=UPI0020BFD15E|nr:GIY-YIG nuclease family protein [Limibaculum sediminis]MCL5779190.1 GIY-YIG nuclease family protein [Limibaculum sediminis]